MTITVKIDNHLLKAKMANLLEVKKVVTPDIYKFFVEHTPIRSGNARNHTVLEGDEIVAAYPYAEKLDEGYSPQAPAGMTKPTEEYAKKLVLNYVKKNGAKK